MHSLKKGQDGSQVRETKGNSKPEMWGPSWHVRDEESIKTGYKFHNKFGLEAVQAETETFA